MMKMNAMVAAALLSSLFDRLGQHEGRPFVSPLELEALRYGIDSLEGRLGAVAAAPDLATRQDPVSAMPPAGVATSVLASTAGAVSEAAVVVERVLGAAQAQAKADVELEHEVALDISSLNRDAPSIPGLTVCLDFGTAMSKAFAGVGYGVRHELELGVAAGFAGFLLPSTLFISTKGLMYFGHEAVERAEVVDSEQHLRIDSIKSSISQWGPSMPDIDLSPLDRDVNPISDVRLTKGDAIRLYLAFFSDIAAQALALHPEYAGMNTSHVLRRYARPCWPNPDQQRVADAKMREMIEQAQILADTFRGKWRGGIPLSHLKSALDRVRELGARPKYLVDIGIPEPVAVASGAVYDIEHARDAFMVVDAGAGTTDLGLFILTNRGEAPVVHQVAKSIRGLMQAGDKVDALVRTVIADREGVDRGDAHGRVVWDELSRRLRSLKETLFSQGTLRYVLSDGTEGTLTKDEFLADSRVVRFTHQIENEFVASLASVDDSWLRLISGPSMRLKVIVTGGSGNLDMMRSLAHGIIDVRGHKIVREPLDAMPSWVMDSAPMQAIYPQLAVAIGGINPELPEIKTAPELLGR